MPAASAARTETSISQLANFLPKQREALDAMYSHKYVLFGGSAGPGKSFWLRWAALHYLFECATAGFMHVHVGIFSEDYPALVDRQINKIKREFPPELGEVRRTDTEGLAFILKEQYGGGVISLRNLDDPSKFASAEWAGIFVDELTKNVKQTFDDLRFRLRWPGIEHTVFCAASNPGSKGHGWVKKLWVDRDFSGDDANFNPNLFCFIRALPRDNPYLTKSYWEELDSLPEAMRRALRDGDWNIFAGQVFSEFAYNVHVKRPFPIPQEWARWCGLDYGYTEPTVCLWLARAPRGAVIEPPGEEPVMLLESHTVVYRELAVKHMLAQDQALNIKSLSIGERVNGIYADPSMWARRGQGDGLSVADEYAAVGVNLTQANNNRLAGWGRVHRALDFRPVSPPELWIFDVCDGLIRTLPSLPSDPIRPEDVDTDAEDHWGDAVRYALMAADPVTAYQRQVGEKPSRWRLTSSVNRPRLSAPR